MRRALLPPVLLLAPLLWLFRRALFAGETFAFRDSAHYYYPLYKYVQERWKDGLPLWNPLDGIGQPLLGDPTAAVLYPGKLIFSLPLPYALCFVLYVTLHLWISGYGAFRYARCLGTGTLGAIVAGLAYELSGQVLFQYCNPIYCVGAAWLPWALLCFERSISSGFFLNGLVFAIVLSLMVLGGDPQMAYHCLLVGGIRVAVFASSHAQPDGRCRRALTILCAAAIIASLLAAAQILPSYEWAQLSDRGARDAPRSIWEWSSDCVKNPSQWPSWNGIWSRDSNGKGHLAKAYEFSVGPWRWSELFWPNVSGHLFPNHTRWGAAYPGSGRLWTPSLYLGLLPITLAVARFRLVRGANRTRWLSWMVLLSVMAALGEYGWGWIANETRYLLDGPEYERSHALPGVGGLYWLLTVLVPGYISFRYPAKWWTIAALGLSVLAAKGWPCLWARSRINVLRPICLCALGLLVFALGGAVIAILRGDVPANSIFGPFEPKACWLSLLGAILHTILTATLLGWVASKRRTVFQAWTLVLLSTLELVVAQGRLVQTLPAAEWDTSQARPTGQTVYRCEPEQSYPVVWRDTASEDRFEQLQRSDLATLTPKHHLSVDTRSVLSAVSMMQADYRAVWQTCARDDSGFLVPQLGLLTAFGVEKIYAPAGAYSLAAKALSVETRATSFANENAFPRAWLVTQWDQIPVFSGVAFSAIQSHTRAVMFDNGNVRDFRDFAIVEADARLPSPLARKPIANECSVIGETAESVTLRAQVNVPSILVLRDQFYPGWRAYAKVNAERQEKAIYRVNRVMRGVFLEPGDHFLEFRYEPWPVRCGVALSGVAWLLVGAAIVLHARKSIDK